MKRTIKRTSLAIVAVVLAGGLYYVHLLTPVITGYAAKNLASGIFVAHRTQESLENTDLNFSFIRFTTNTVDTVKKEVTSRFLWARSKAIYIDGFGCTLVRDFSEEEIRNRPYTIEPLPAGNPDTIDWPMGDRLADTLPAGINPAKLQQAIRRSFADTAGTTGTFAVAVAFKNQLVAEEYREGFSKNNRFLSWSVAKSFTHALVGILVKKGMLCIHEPLNFEEWEDDIRRDITLNHLMHMNAGQEWNENYGNLSDVTLMLHKAPDMAHFSIRKKALAPPDSIWLYNSGATNIVTAALRTTIANDNEYYSFPRRELFNPTGMRSVIFETDASGNFAGSSYIYASMRDYVRFGMLYLNNGNWLGNQLLPDNWSELAMQPTKGSGGQYGSLFWLNQSGDYPDAPADMFMCRGHDGQYIYILPSHDLVIVRTGFSKKGQFDTNAFVASILGAIE